MSNPQTSEEWKKVAESQQAAATSLRTQENQIRQNQKTLNDELDQVASRVSKDKALIQFAERRIARGDTIPPETQQRLDEARARFAVDSAREQELTKQLDNIQTTAGPIATQRVNAELAARDATRKAEEAAKGPPAGNSVTEPAGDNKNASSQAGSPTAVQLDPPSVQPAQSQLTPTSSGLTPGTVTPEGFVINPQGVPSITVQLERPPEPPPDATFQAQPASTEQEQQAQDAAFINAEAQRQAESDLGATQAEADAIAQAQKQADQSEYESQVGATQGEADAINQAINQKQAEEAPGATQEEADFINQTAEAQGEAARQASRGIQGAVNNTREQAIIQDTINFNQIPDWRVRLSLAPSATYLYKASEPGILKPLQATNGVVFPYTPSIGMSYNANYAPEDLIHSNYKIYQYRNSSVEQITITADFTAQDAKEAAYVLAVIHFFRSVTKMFYGKDQNPKAGVPPPLCFIYGMGDFQFNQHPLLISGFSYNLPNDVDYIRAGAPTLTGGQTSSGFSTPNNAPNATNVRMQSSNVPVGGKPNPPNWTTKTNIEPTYIPTKLQLSITALPIVTRKDISDNFSLKDYSTGLLLRGRQNSRGGIW